LKARLEQKRAGAPDRPKGAPLAPPIKGPDPPETAGPGQQAGEVRAPGGGKAKKTAALLALEKFWGYNILNLKTTGGESQPPGFPGAASPEGLVRQPVSIKVGGRFYGSRHH